MATTYAVTPSQSGTSFQIAIVSDNGARQTMLGFETEADAETWIEEDKQRHIDHPLKDE